MTCHALGSVNVTPPPEPGSNVALNKFTAALPAAVSSGVVKVSLTAVGTAKTKAGRRAAAKASRAAKRVGCIRVWLRRIGERRAEQNDGGLSRKIAIVRG